LTVIHHIALEVREDEAGACVAFWALLGFAEVEPPAALRGDTRWVQRGDQQVHLMLRDDPVAPPAGHVAVVAPRYEEALERLRAAGFEPDPRREHWGSPRAFVDGPAGHRVELMMFPPR
jgi:catechol 2,3-dioxygenase-like lactoylglutathione lyase family enzyme